MRVKLKQLIAATTVGGFDTLNAADLVPALSWRMTLVVDQVNGLLDKFYAQREKMLKQYPDGEEFKKAMDALIDEEVELPYPPILLGDLGHTRIKPVALAELKGWFIVETLPPAPVAPAPEAPAEPAH